VKTTEGTPAITTREAAKALNLETHQLLYLLRTGKVSEPARLGSYRAWHESDLQRAREALAEMEAAK